MHQQKPLIFRINDSGSGPELVREVLLKRGWVEYAKGVHAPYEWNLWWRTSRFRDADYEQLFPWQRLNHYPRSTGITRKDSLARLLRLMAGAYGSAYNFAPPSYVLPHEYRRFVSDYSAAAAAAAASDKQQPQFWIYKPADLSRGRGIVLFRELSELHYDTHGVVQRYVTNPLLISGYKFDLRMYVVVRRYGPLLLYVYDDGLARFGTDKYNLSTLNNVYSHLTNSSINKNSPSYADDKAGIGPGCKWSIKQLRQYLHHRRIEDGALWWRILTLLVLTVAPLAAEAPNVAVDERFGGSGGGGSIGGSRRGAGGGGPCLELFGFDILVDESLRPWLLEVNFSPALTTDCHLDVEMKSAMLGDLVDLMAFDSEDALCGGELFRSRQRNATSALARSRILRPASSGRPLPDALRAGLGHGSSRGAASDVQLSAPPPRSREASAAARERADSEPSDDDDEVGAGDVGDGSASTAASRLASGRHRRKRRTRSVAIAASAKASDDVTPKPRVASPSRNASADRSQRRFSARKSNSDEPVNSKVMHVPPPALLEYRGNAFNYSEPSGSTAQGSPSASSCSTHGDFPKRVGGFCRIYPFNEVTARSQLSLRNIVSETTKLFRQQTENTLPQRKTGREKPARNSYDIDNPFPELRRPREKSSYWYLD